MSDDLVKRLRDWEHVYPEDYNKDEGHLYDEAADRIEELEAQQAKTYQALLKVTKIHDEVEAKLAKAVEALEEIATDEHPLGWIAIAALTELKGEK